MPNDVERIWIKTAWVIDQGNQSPWLVAAYDELTFEEWGEEPEFYKDDLAKYRGEHVLREAFVYVDLGVIRQMFEPAKLGSKVVPVEQP